MKYVSRVFVGCLAFVISSHLFGADSASANRGDLATAIANALSEKQGLEKERADIVSTETLLKEAEAGQPAARAAFATKASEWQKELDLHNEVKDQFLRDSDAHQKNAKAQHAVASDHASEVASHNSECSGTTSDQGWVDFCAERAYRLNARAEEIMAWANSVDQSKADLTARAENLDTSVANLQKSGEMLDIEEDLLNKMDASLVRQRETLNERTLAWSAKVKANNDRLNTLYAIQGKVDECLKKSRTLEAQKHCSNIPFDGERTDLSEMGNRKGPFSASPNK